MFEYDDSDELSILNYAKKLENKTFRNILEEFQKSPIRYYPGLLSLNPSIMEDDTEYNPNNRAKGELGNFLERYYFGYKPNSKQEADFPKVGVELKQTCVDLKKNGKLRAGERLSITNISYEKPIEPDFYKSHAWEKMRRMLLVHYLRDKTKDRLDNQILFVNLFTPPQEDLEIIIEDYKKINTKIKSGLAHELSESDTLYLGACTKGATAKKSLQEQFYGDKRPARKRNFCLKRSYMDYILNAYVLKNKVPYERIIKVDTDLTNKTFEEYIVNKINSYAGMSDKDLCVLFNKEYTKNKSQWSTLAYRMLGIKSNKAEEFVKAGIVVKTIRIEENDCIKESMSIAPFLFKDLAVENWEDSTVYTYFNETRFLFVIYKKENDYYKLLGAQIWNMPFDDLNNIVYKGWKNIQNHIRNGVTFKKIGNQMQNSLPKKADNPIIHIRPHSAKSAYKLKDGTMIGNIEKDANELPNGEWMTTHSFWLNNTYISSQLKLK